MAGVNQPMRFVTLSRHKVPSIYPWRELTTAGGLMSYGAETMRHVDPSVENLSFDTDLRKRAKHRLCLASADIWRS
jgi:hypothetical protein